MNDYLNGHSSDWYAGFVMSESDRIAAALAHDPEAVVTTCGNWSLRRLVQHIGSVHRWATYVVEHGEAPADRSVLMAPPDADLAVWFIDGAAQATKVLGELDPTAPMWNPWPVPQIAGVWPRRQAQETAVHRYDAQLAVGTAEPIDATLASDGIDEYFLWAIPRRANDGLQIPSGSLHVHCTDVDGEWLVGDVGEGYRVLREHAKGDAALRGAASDLLLSLWGRPISGTVEVVGDDTVAAAWLALGGH